MEFTAIEGSPFIFPLNNPPDNFQFGYFQGETIPWTYTVTVTPGTASSDDYDVVPVPPSQGFSGSQIGGFISFIIVAKNDDEPEPLPEQFSLTIFGTFAGPNPYGPSVSADFTFTFNILDNTPPPLPFTLTPFVDGPFISTQPGAVFDALPTTTNTLNAGDNFGSNFTTPADQGTLNFTAVTPTAGGNPQLATNVTMFGVKTANITNSTEAGTGPAGFSGNVTDLTDVNVTGNANGVQLGAAGAGLNTALQNVSTNQAFEAFFTADALLGATDTLNLTLNGVTGPAAPVALTNVTGTNGYETANITSALGANNIALNTNATSLATITATGSQNLTVGGTAFNIANLHTFDGSAATGKLDVTFNGTGNVAATGGSADDIFRFKSPGFTSASSVNGGGGNNILATEINAGAILATGVGPNITNVQTIQHITDPAATGAFTADMALSGSATKLELAGNYANQNVSVSNLTDADSVVYTGPAAGAIGNIGTLTLAHEAPVVVGNINFTMAAAQAVANLQVVTLTVAPGVILNIESVGNAANNVINNVAGDAINDVAGVQVNVNITGGTHLDFGSQASPYSFQTGVIDASANTGGVQTWLAGDSTPLLTQSETFIGGTGPDVVHFLDFRADLADFSAGGSDTAEFRALSPFVDESIGEPTDELDFNKVTGFVLDDAINTLGTATDPLPIGQLQNTAVGVFQNTTATGALVQNGAPISEFRYDNQLVNAPANAPATIPFNYIHADNPVTGTTFADAFDAVMGPFSGPNDEDIIETGFINTGVIFGKFLMSFYSDDEQVAVFFAIEADSDGFIQEFSLMDILGVVGMSFADYTNLSGANIHFGPVA